MSGRLAPCPLELGLPRGRDRAQESCWRNVKAVLVAIEIYPCVEKMNCLKHLPVALIGLVRVFNQIPK